MSRSQTNLAGVYYSQGKYVEAESLLNQSLILVERTLGPDHPDVGTALDDLGEIYRIQGQYAKAEPIQKRAMAIIEKALGPDHPKAVAIREKHEALKKEVARGPELKKMKPSTVKTGKGGRDERVLDFSTLLFFVSSIGLIAGLIRPGWVIRWGREKTRVTVLLTFGSGLIVSLVWHFFV